MKVFCMDCRKVTETTSDGAHCQVCDYRYIIFRNAAYTDVLRAFLGVDPRRVVVTEEQAKKIAHLYAKRHDAMGRVKGAQETADYAQAELDRIMDDINGVEVVE